MAHTPGPWTIEYETEGGEPYDDGVRIDSPEGPVAFNVIDCSAHLIAAAPELLAALKGVAAAHTCIESCDMPEWLDAVEAVIAKAEGRSE